jgi:hypothetical protein
MVLTGFNPSGDFGAASLSVWSIFFAAWFFLPSVSHMVAASLPGTSLGSPDSGDSSQSAIPGDVRVSSVSSSPLAPTGRDSQSFEAMVLLIVDAVIFAFGSLVTGILDGWATKHAVAGSFYCQENYAIVDSLLQNTAARLLAPPFGRFLIFTSLGRTAYGILQVLLGAAGILLVEMLRGC